MRKLVRFTYNQFKESLIEKKRFKFYYGKRFDVKNYFTIYLLVSSFFIRILSRILFLLFKRNLLSINVVYKNGLIIKFPFHFYINNIEDLFSLYSEYYFNDYFKYFGKELQVQENDIIIDIGAHIGTFSLPISYLFKTLVYAFEPNVSNYQYLNDNIQTNSLQDRIHLYNVAVSKGNDLAEFTEGDASTRGFLTQNKLLKTKFGGNTYQVKTMSLNDFTDNEKITKIDILKIDCEGAEYDIIYNLKDNIFSMTKLIFIEIHRLIENQDPERLIEYIKGKGFNGKYNALDNGCYECVFIKNEK